MKKGVSALLFIASLVISAGISVANWYLVPIKFLFVIIPVFALAFIGTLVILSSLYYIIRNEKRKEYWSIIRIFLCTGILLQSALIAKCRPEGDWINYLMLIITLLSFLATILSLILYEHEF